MNTDQLSRLLKNTHAGLVALSASKGEEYTQGQDERLANFLDGAKRIGVHPVQYLLFGLDKHYNSVADFAKRLAKGKTLNVSEPIDGRLMDLILYATLARALIPQLDGDLPPGSRMHDAEFPLANVSPCSGAAARRADAAGDMVKDERYLDPRIVRPADAPSDSIGTLQALVRRWASKTFPKRSVDTVKLKLTTHEMPELLVSLGAKHESKKIPGEIADVLILLLDYCDIKGIDINAEIRAKMEINESRSWTVDSHGISSHVRAPESPDA